MTDPQQDDLTEHDGLVQQTGNGLQPDDPTDQPDQEPTALPEGTETEDDMPTPSDLVDHPGHPELDQ